MKLSKIKKITKISLENEIDVYDISTPENRNFIANGAVVHNSEFSNIANSSCNLGSLNLTKYVKNGEFDFIEFGNDVGIATRFLDSIIDINEFPTEKIHETTHAIRPIGLGVMGLAHAMILMKIPYASKEAKDFTKRLIGYITMRSMQESVQLAKEKEPYTAFDYETFIKANARFFNGVELPMNGVNLYGIHDVDIFKLKDDVKKFGVRNSCFTSIAPTGCRVKESSIIMYDNSVSTMESIFNDNGIDLGKLEARESKHKFNQVVINGKPVMHYDYSFVNRNGKIVKVRNDKLKIGDKILTK